MNFGNGRSVVIVKSVSGVYVCPSFRIDGKVATLRQVYKLLDCGKPVACGG